MLDGTAELKAAIQHKFKHDNGLDFALNEITAGAGAKQILYNALMASVNPGDEVILPAPYWTSYADMVLIAAVCPWSCLAPRPTAFASRPEQLRAAITPRTRWVFINSPSNPSGAAYSAEQLRPVPGGGGRHPQVWSWRTQLRTHPAYDGLAFAMPAAGAAVTAPLHADGERCFQAHVITGWRWLWCRPQGADR